MNIHNYKNVFICATEQSGDNIGSCIINELLIKNKNIKFDGVGGEKISPFLRNQYFSLHDFKSIGIFEIILSLKKNIHRLEICLNWVHFLVCVPVFAYWE